MKNVGSQEDSIHRHDGFDWLLPRSLSRLPEQGRYQEILSEFMCVISDSMSSAVKEKYRYADPVGTGESPRCGASR
jgi:hypothetical protein